MPLDVARVRQCLQSFDFRRLFVEELGWDRHVASLCVVVDGKRYTLQAIAEKRGFQVFACAADDSGRIPDYPTRGKIERQVAKSAHEHIIIYTDAARSAQKWQWVRRELGRPIAPREYDLFKGQTAELLVQKLQYVAVELSDEEGLTLVDVTRRARQAFDVDRVTRRFYDRFKGEHAAFLQFIRGITAAGDREWYASLMLNRLMFIYFIQGKGFLDGDRDYLRNRLKAVQQRKGKDWFVTFYRHFLLRLFHEGLGQPPALREKDLDELLGEVPFLNGGLFEVHELERAYPDIQIADEAFERLFDFFDAYQWQLDERPLRAGNEINPDVLGYIFEKYVNQKQMGAYYTREDITGYIARNTIIPFLLDAARKECAIAFRPDSALWRLLRDDPDRYIYEPVRRGVVDQGGDVIPESALPHFVQRGMRDPLERMFDRRYNLGEADLRDAAGNKLTLPTETWREYVARRERCLELREMLSAGEVHGIDDLITYNLDICHFAEDAIQSCEGPELLRAFYRAIERVSVLDPTCGSGAFLFAALNVLEPLYQACLERMEGFLEDLERSGDKHRPEKYTDLRRTMEEVARHPNRRYFILKSVIVNNLYGVDIMEEAVEICKLRLFLKLVAQLDRVQQIEPLPDVDFSIRAGNTLVGFVSLEQVSKAAEKESSGQGRLPFAETAQAIRRVNEEAEVADRAFGRFREMQTRHGMDATAFAEAKLDLRRRLDGLRDELDRFLAGEYGVDTANPPALQQWRASHRPFHWLAEYYGIMHQGGFDVIIGNPPWVEYAKVKKDYRVRNYVTEVCGNLHAMCTERGLQIRSPSGRMSFIVQLPMTSSSRMAAVRQVLRAGSSLLHVASFGDRPGKLFEGLEHSRALIWLSRGSPRRNGGACRLATSRYHRWPTEVRPFLFELLEYASVNGVPLHPDQFPKYANRLQAQVFRKHEERATRALRQFVSPRQTSPFVFYQEATEYWVKATAGLPYYAKDGKVGAPAHGRYLCFAHADATHWACAIMHSSLFFVHFVAYGDCFHLSDATVRGFPVPAALGEDRRLVQLGKALMEALREGAVRKSIETRDGHKISYDEYYGWKAKATIDQIDRVLAEHYGFTDEELDFIINYDIKYRMGEGAAGQEDEQRQGQG